MNEERCSNCKCWDVIDPPVGDVGESDPAIPDSGYGYCRRFPPVRVEPDEDYYPGTEISFYRQPTVSGDDWCAEWRSSL
jgi:hypothetical protein